MGTTRANLDDKLPPVIDNLKAGMTATAPKDGPGLLATATTGAAVEAKSTSGSGVDATSDSGEAVHAESNSPTLATIAAYKQNPNGTGAAIYGKNAGTKGDAGFFDGTVHITGVLTVDQDVAINGADCAEEFDISAGESISPGTVMVLDTGGKLSRSSCEYDKRVAGVISGAGVYRPALVLDRRGQSASRLPLALVGKAYCLVDASNGPIEVGDLLTTSATPGHAMKLNDPFRGFGAAIGKALTPHREGTGLIPILIALQ
jgi:hypothetical protein